MSDRPVGSGDETAAVTTDRLLVCDVAEDVRAGRRSAQELLEAHLDRIASRNPELGAFVFVDAERARTAALAVDRQVARGEDPGPLAGVPMGVKALEPVRGWPHTMASRLWADQVATTTSVQVARAEAAGAVPVGLTASPELGSLSFTASELYGVCRNPWALSRTPGGSSGGSAAAVAAGLVPLATGSDSAGSLRIPASFTGLVGFKGTYGRIPRGPGQLGAANLRCYGALTLTVRDTARFLDVVAGTDERDPSSLPRPGLPFEDAIDTLDLTGFRAAWAGDLGFGRCEPAVVRTVREAALALISDAGLEEWSETIVLPDPAMAFEVLLAIDLWPALRPHIEGGRDDVGARVRDGFRFASGLTVSDVNAANEARHAFNDALASLFERVDLLLLPATSTPAFAAEGPMPAVIGGESVTPLETVAPTYGFNVSGHPAVSVPAGIVDGLPVGLQIVAPRHEDLRVLAAARALERARPWPFLTC